MPGENHGWTALDRYIVVHERCMEDVSEYFVIKHDLGRPVLLTSELVRFTGTMQCHGNIESHVNLVLWRDERNRVRGRRFRFHALRRVVEFKESGDFSVVNILRYDNSEHFKSHPDAFHKHLFADDGSPIGVEHVGRQNLPSLRNVIDEVFDWWQAHRGKPPLAR